MQEVARVVADRVVLLVRIEHDHVVELEALDLANVGDVDAGQEREVLAGDQAQARDLGQAQGLVVGQRLLGIAGDQRDRGARLALHQGS